MSSLRNRLFQSWFRFRRPMTLGVRGLVLRQDGQVLLVRHTYVPGLFFPGGGVEKAETVETALSRELREEAGVALQADPVLAGVFSNHLNFPNDHVILFRVTAEAWTPCPADNSGEIAELVWCDPAAPPEDATPGTRRRLAEHVAGHAGSGHW